MSNQANKTPGERYLAAKRALFDQKYAFLNEKQREAVYTTQGPLLVLAGAGSGKTRVLTYRIAYLLEQGLVKPWEILAITFTNKAAKEMKERVTGLVGDEAKDMWLGTFHGICVRILKREIELLGYTRDFNIMDELDKQRVVKDILKRRVLSLLLAIMTRLNFKGAK